MVLMEVLEKQDFRDLEQTITKKENIYKGVELFYDHMKTTQKVCG